MLTLSSDGNIRYFEYENDKFEFLSEYKSADPQRGIAFVPRRGINVHENEVMRAYKTINDTHIEPISFTVPRRAETFQSDIFPPATGIKPALSAKDWFDGKSAVPAKIDLESVYEGNAPVEVPADYKPPVAAPAPAPAPAPAAAPAAKKEPEPAPVPVRAPVSVADQKSSISAMANKFQDNEEEEESEDDAETSSFEEISRPAPRAAVQARPQPVTTAAPPAQAKPVSPVSPVKPPQAAAAPVARAAPAASPVSRAAPAASPAAAGSSSPAVEESLDRLTHLINAQSEQIAAQTQMITLLASEVEMLKKRVGASTHDQSERIRQLELELEEARS